MTAHRLCRLLLSGGLLVCLLLFGGAPAWAQAVRIDRLTGVELGPQALYLQEDGGPLSLAQAREALRLGRFHADGRRVASFGLGAPPVWIYLELHNPLDQALQFRLLAGMSWIDKLDIALVQHDQVIESWHSGDASDAVNGAAAVVPGLGFTFPLWVPPGRTELFVRAATPDPMMLPLSLLPVQQVSADERYLHYGYGLLYGFLLALIAYNAMVFFGLRSGSYLYYALYLLCFIALNLSYTGHGYAWWWADHVQFQRYVNPVLMVLFGICGLQFSDHFLKLRAHPRARRIRLALQGLSGAVLLAMAVCVVQDLHLAALWLAFGFLSLFTFGMVAMGLWAVGRGTPASRYFLGAALCGLGGAGITLLAVFRWFPVNRVTFHSAEAGLLLEAILLALALASHMREQQAARQQAEQQARTDALTGLANRRAFFEQARGLWNTAQRRQRPLSVVMLDIDRFKAINDRYGHDGGDQVLVRLAELLRQTCRAGDVSSRWGGEEFLLLLPETELAQALALAERLRVAVEGSVLMLGNQPVEVTVSLGVAQLKADQTLELLINDADQRLYRAKTEGRNRVAGPG